jgi:PPOX class probable F420-dependent enzyme
MSVASLTTARFFSLATYRKSGAAVETPVWYAEKDGKYYVFSAGEAGKVKRLRNSGYSRIAACTATGSITGEWVETEARLLASEEEHIALAALRDKYGWQMRLTDLGSKITGKFNKRTYIEVSPSTPSR